MGRRSDGFEKRPNDFYATPAPQAEIIARRLAPRTRFIEPCAGDGALVMALEAAGHVCVAASDIEPRDPEIATRDGADAGRALSEYTIVTNPPWSRELLLPLLDAWIESPARQVWLLLASTHLMNRYSGPYAPRTAEIIPAGRPKWIADSKWSAKDDACWVRLVGGGDFGLLKPRGG